MAIALDEQQGGIPEAAVGGRRRQPMGERRGRADGGRGDRGRGDRARVRVPKAVRVSVLTVHVLASVGWFGVAVTVALVGAIGQSRGEIAFYEVIDATLALSIPLGLASAATGVALSLTTRWGLVTHWWVVLKELGAVAVIATDVLIVAPVMQRAVDAGTPAEMPGPVYAHCVVLALATALSVVKPRARTPLGRRPA
jgi:hypothetical protein